MISTVLIGLISATYDMIYRVSAASNILTIQLPNYAVAGGG